MELVTDEEEWLCWIKPARFDANYQFVLSMNKRTLNDDNNFNEKLKTNLYEDYLVGMSQVGNNQESYVERCPADYEWDRNVEQHANDLLVLHQLSTLERRRHCRRRPPHLKHNRIFSRFIQLTFN